MVNVVILGAGFMGRVHAECYHSLPNARLVAVGDIDLEKASKLAKNYNARPSSQVDELIKNENINLVDICLPTFLHKEYAIKGARAGKHILCEKPIALTIEDADRMVKAADEAKVKFMVAQVIRFWPEYVELRRIYEEESLGKMFSVSLTRLGTLPTWSWRRWMLDPEKSGSALIDLHIHDTDYLLFLLGKPTSLFSQGIKTDIGYGHIFTTFTFPQGIVASVEGGWNIKAADFPFTMAYKAIFEGGVVEFNIREEKSLSIYRKGRKVEHPAIQEKLFPSQDAGGNISQLGAYFLEIKYLLDCIENDKAPTLIDARSAKDSLRIVLMEKESAETGQVIRFEKSAKTES